MSFRLAKNLRIFHILSLRHAEILSFIRKKSFLDKLVEEKKRNQLRQKLQDVEYDKRNVSRDLKTIFGSKLRFFVGSG